MITAFSQVDHPFRSIRLEEHHLRVGQAGAVFHQEPATVRTPAKILVTIPHVDEFLIRQQGTGFFCGHIHDLQNPLVFNIGHLPAIRRDPGHVVVRVVDEQRLLLDNGGRVKVPLLVVDHGGSVDSPVPFPLPRVNDSPAIRGKPHKALRSGRARDPPAHFPLRGCGKNFSTYNVRDLLTIW